MRKSPAMVVHSDVFERFTQGDTIPLMTQAVMENALSPRIIDQLFEDVTERQYTRDLLFSSIVELMSLVVCRIQPSINAAYVKNAVPINVSLQALYRKIGRIETPVGSALVRTSDERLAPVITALGGELTPFLPGYRTRLIRDSGVLQGGRSLPPAAPCHAFGCCARARRNPRRSAPSPARSHDEGGATTSARTRTLPGC